MSQNTPQSNFSLDHLLGIADTEDNEKLQKLIKENDLRFGKKLQPLRDAYEAARSSDHKTVPDRMAAEQRLAQVLDNMSNTQNPEPPSASASTQPKPPAPKVKKQKAAQPAPQPAPEQEQSEPQPAPVLTAPKKKQTEAETQKSGVEKLTGWLKGVNSGDHK